MHDIYETPLDVVFDLIDAEDFDFNEGSKILEPAAGGGNIIKALRSAEIPGRITAIELETEFEASLKGILDGKDRLIIDTFLADDITAETIGTFETIITNPPYSKLELYIEKCHGLLNHRGKLALLLRLNHLTGVRRGRFLEQYKPSVVHLLCQRPDFGIKAIDSAGYAWVVWEKGVNAPTFLNWIRKDYKSTDGRRFGYTKRMR